MKDIILASASPRRLEIMKKYGYEPTVITASVSEELPMPMTPEASTMYLALKKAFAADELLHQDLDKPLPGACENTDTEIIIAADTVVVFRGKIIGKPKDEDDALRTLYALRNNVHHVVTGVCILETPFNATRKAKSHDTAFPSRRPLCLFDRTAVHFTDIGDEELLAYVKTAEPYDKAGGYAIQGTFKRYIDHIDGDRDNVIGLPWKTILPHVQ